MSQAILAKQEPTLSSYEDTTNQSSTMESFHVETPVSSDFTMLNSTTLWGFSLLVVILVVRVFGRKQKRPLGAKPLPRLPGKLRLISVDDYMLTVARYTMDRSVLGYPYLRRRGSMAFWRFPQVLWPHLRMGDLWRISCLD